MRSKVWLNLRYKFNIKKFPKTKAIIPDNINELNTPQLSADHRVVKRMTNVPGITPLLVGRKLDNKKQMDMYTKPNLKEIKEKDDDEDDGKEDLRARGKKKNIMNNLRKYL